MNIYKFGGESVKNANGIRNISQIISNYYNTKLVVVISAAGKTTNSLEKLLNFYYYKWNETEYVFSLQTLKNNYQPIETDVYAKAQYTSPAEALQAVYNYHFQIINELFDGKNQQVTKQFDDVIQTIINKLKLSPSKYYDFEYDQIVSYGELISTLIVSAYLEFQQVHNFWKDIRYLIRTDNRYREPNVDWELSTPLIKNSFSFTDTNLYITQGFIGSSEENFTVTLGREGSDYSASILASILEADKVVIWKDVAGVYNADPKFYPKSEKLNFISYDEAIDLTYYGAKVIHPKTIKPLQSKNIPLFVKSFNSPDEEGTKIGNSDSSANKAIPFIINKTNQGLLSLSPKNSAYLNEEKISNIFTSFSKHRVRANLIQNDAQRLSVSIDCTGNVPDLINQLEQNFTIDFQNNSELITIQKYNKETIDEVVGDRNVLLQSQNQNVARFLVKNK